jgi:hypothetical protein
MQREHSTDASSGLVVLQRGKWNWGDLRRTNNPRSDDKDLNKRASGYGKTTKIQLSESLEAKHIPMALGFGYNRCGLKCYRGNIS